MYKLASVAVLAASCFFFACKSKVIPMRQTEYPVVQLILDRWSSRAMSGEAISDNDLMTLLEAAHFAPSSFNSQPWRFIVGKKGTENWNKLFDVLVPFNQSWCKNGAVLILVISQKNFAHNGQPSVTHSFDTGAACENMSLQATAMNLVCHGMSGFDYDKARTAFNIPHDYAIEAMFVIGKSGDKKMLPEGLAEKEKPADRISVERLVFFNDFKV